MVEKIKESTVKAMNITKVIANALVYLLAFYGLFMIVMKSGKLVEVLVK